MKKKNGNNEKGFPNGNNFFTKQNRALIPNDECHGAVRSKLRIMLMEMMKRLKNEEME